MNPQEPIQHTFLEYDSKRPLTSKASGIAAYILNRYTGDTLSVTRYRKGGKLSMSHKTTFEKWQFRFDDIVRHIIETRSFDAETFNFPRIHCDWLDLVEITHDAPRVKDESGTLRFQ